MTDRQDLRGAVATPAPVRHGVRTELRLLAADEQGVHYEARWFFGQGAGSSGAAPSASGRAELDAKGTVTLHVEVGDVPPWARDFTEKLLRTALRSQTTGAGYPRRLTRWRAAPAAAASSEEA